MEFNPFRERDRGSQAGEEPLGRVVSVSGSQAGVRLRAPSPAGGPAEAERATVGSFLGIRSGPALLIGLITNVAAPTHRGDDGDHHATVQVDLLGEIRESDGKGRFQRGITHYPAIGDSARLVTSGELRLAYDIAGADTIHIGQLQQDAAIGAHLNVEDMLRKHFAVLGTTGVGKSSGVALILREILDARPDLRVFLIDPHNEYARCFEERAQVLTPRNLDLPFWLFNFEETVDVFFRGRPGLEEEVEILAEAIPQAKARFAAERGAADKSNIRKDAPKATGFTVDTPAPYRLADLIALIDARMGQLENRSLYPRYHRLLTRIETVRNDPRYAFMFESPSVGSDSMAQVLSELFRLPPRGKPMTIMQLAGFPAEVVDSVVSVLCRMAFDFGLWSDGAIPLLFVCEEAHRYASADRSTGFGPTRKALSRIAKEGRKYGVFLGLVTQRPAELDATIVSQCSTLLAMRLANERDQALIRAAVSDAAASLLSFVPSLGTREAFAFGEGVPLPTRLRFKELPAHLLPKSEGDSSAPMDASREVEMGFIAAVVERWRGATMGGRIESASEAPDFESLAKGDASLLRRAFAAEGERGVSERPVSILKTGSGAPRPGAPNEPLFRPPQGR